MKHLIRTFLFSTFTVWLLDRFVPGFNLGDNLQTLALTSLALMFVTLIVIPLLSIIFMPINIITIGLFKWILTAGVLFGIITYASFITITDWQFAGFNYFIPYANLPVELPPYSFTLWPNLILLAASYNLFLGFFGWLCSE